MYKVNDFFCGAGGMGLGFQQAGFQLVGAWDMDKAAVTSYRHNVADHVQQVDIATLIANDLPIADIWTFGFPCQDISVAGKQRGMVQGVTRSGMFFEIMRLLDETPLPARPTILVAENVKAVRSYLPTIEQEFKERGYQMTAQLINSSEWGVPQHRERYFIVGVKQPITEPFSFPIPTTSPYPNRVYNIIEQEVDPSYYLSQDDDVLAAVKQAVKKSRPNQEISIKVLANGNIRPHRNDARKSGISEMQVVHTTNLAPTCISSHVTKIYGVPITGIRQFTPREYARLQGFPDSYEQVVSDRQFYKQMGNAVTVSVAEALAKAIHQYLTTYVEPLKKEDLHE